MKLSGIWGWELPGADQVFYENMNSGMLGFAALYPTYAFKSPSL
jgi:hypothetical protein